MLFSVSDGEPFIASQFCLEKPYVNAAGEAKDWMFSHNLKDLGSTIKELQFLYDVSNLQI